MVVVACEGRKAGESAKIALFLYKSVNARWLHQPRNLREQLMSRREKDCCLADRHLSHRCVLVPVATEALK